MLSRRFAIAVAAIFALAGGIAYAAIPDAGTGVYHACMLKNIGTIRIIDPDKQHCVSALETEITFNKQGPAGPPGLNGTPGTNGVSPTVKQLAAGDPTCPTGGAAITDASGSTAYVCSGQNGTNGQNGADGQSFTGTFTSPNGLYSISVTDNGITLKGTGTSSVKLTGNDFSLRAHDVELAGDIGMGLRSGDGLSIHAGGDLNMMGANAELEGQANLALKGASVSVNQGPGCVPAARTNDPVVVPVDVENQTVLGSILTGSPDVCIG